MTRRFQINPGPLKVRGAIPKEDPNAGRCEGLLRDGSGRCLHDGTVELSSGHWVCAVHARRAATSEEQK